VPPCHDAIGSSPGELPADRNTAPDALLEYSSFIVKYSNERHPSTILLAGLCTLR
jgi:hypothetical protein